MKPRNIIFATIIITLFAGCSTPDYSAFYDLQRDHANRDARPLVSVVADENQQITVSGVAMLTVYQPMWDADPQQHRRQPGALENVAVSVAPSLVQGMVGIYGIQQTGRTSRANARENRLLFESLSAGSGGGTDAGQFFDGINGTLDTVFGGVGDLINATGDE